MSLFLRGIFLFVFVLTACRLQKPIKYDPKELGIEDNCQPSKATYFYDSLLTPKYLQTEVADSNTIKRFSLRARNISISIGAMHSLNRFTLLEPLAHQGSDSAKLALLFVRQEIDERLSLALLDVSTVQAEIDCEKERAMQLRNYLTQMTNKRVKILNIGSIVVGAVGTLISSAISLNDPAANIPIQEASILGAVAGGYLALRQIFIRRSAFFAHPRNHLREIWENPSRPIAFPPNVWHFMTKEFPLDGRNLSRRQLLLNEFREIRILGKDSTDRQERIKLFFGDGGEYNVEHLSNRINMLELLETEINLMKYDLKRLHQEVLLSNIER
ncbi:MAG TPA: hypothetical protein VNW99_08675 [Cytophagaceae bacterium]|jgi:hypothetical protein|nr:hypothetical protein [Cytophagaceae bacterium]